MVRERLAPGTVIDGFRLEERLHQGSMASLWRVVPVAGPDGDGALVMKLPMLGQGDDPTAIVGFEVEQMILPRLAGPHVPRFVAAGDFSRRAYLVMEWIDGGCLADRLRTAPLLPAAEVADIGARIALALHDIHAQHVIHFDLKPANVLFRPGGEAVLIDYGLARHDQLPDFLAEEFRLPMGTGAYIAPEQVLGNRNDLRSDLFALGVTLYQMATGRLPFGAPASVAGLRRRLAIEPPPPRALVPDCPPWLQEVILRCLAVDPAQRYDTAAALAFALQHPALVPLGARARLTRRPSWLARLGRRLDRLSLPADPGQSAARQLSRAPFIAIAIDPAHTAPALAEALRAAARQLAAATPGARLACLCVLKTARFGMDITVDGEGNNRHVAALVALRHWARPLELPEPRVTYHVLEAPDAAAALVDYARVNRVDHLVLAARGQSTWRRYLGSVSAQVTAEAPCTVTVVRARQPVTAAAPPAEPAWNDPVL